MKIGESKKKLLGSIVSSLIIKPTISRMRVELPNGNQVVVHRFIVTGVLYRSNNKRFVLKYAGTIAGYFTAMHINLYKGSVWGVRSDTGKKVLLKRVNN